MKTKKILLIVPLAIILVGFSSCGPAHQFMRWVGIEKHHEYSVVDPEPDAESFPVTVINHGLGGKLSPEGLSYIENGKNFPVYSDLEFGGKLDSLQVNDKLTSFKGNPYSFPVDKLYKLDGYFSVTIPWYIVRNKWRLDALVDQQPDGSWTTIPQWGVPGRRHEIFTFSTTGKFQVVNDNGNFGDPQDWIVDETKTPALLFYGNGTLKSVVEIEKVDSTSMVWVGKVTYDNPSIPPTKRKLEFSNIK